MYQGRNISFCSTECPIKLEINIVSYGCFECGYFLYNSEIENKVFCAVEDLEDYNGQC